MAKARKTAKVSERKVRKASASSYLDKYVREHVVQLGEFGYGCGGGRRVIKKRLGAY
jgi:hypothetical protein